MKKILNHAAVFMMNLLISTVLFGSVAHSQSTKFVERTIDITTENSNQQASRQAMINQATEKVSEELIKEIIGESKYSRNKGLIQDKIIKNSARYLPFSKAGEIKKLPEGGQSMTVTLRVSTDDLQSLLLENGLFYEQDGTPIVIPFVRFTDKVNLKSYAWWNADENMTKGFLVRASKGFETALKTALMKNSFYLIRAQTLKYSRLVPPNLKNENLRFEDQQSMAGLWNAQITIDGDVQITKSPERSEAYMVSVKLTALQNINGRVFAEVVRNQETDSGPFEFVVDRKWKEILEPATSDLASQILEAWQKGAIGASLYKLSIRGRIPVPVQESLKEALKSKLKEVKDIKERLISGDNVIYEIDSSVGPQEIAKRVQQFETMGSKFVLDSVSEKEISYRVSK
jgi:hypothetical protein